MLLWILIVEENLLNSEKLVIYKRTGTSSRPVPFMKKNE